MPVSELLGARSPLMGARRTIYIPSWIERRLRAELPAAETISGVATRSLEARVHALDGCDHDHPLVCAHCLQAVESGVTTG